MDHYRKSLVIEAPPEAVYDALATPRGVRGWWNTGCEGDFAAGEEFDLHFGPNHKRFRIEALQPWREVRWLCTHSHMLVGSATPHQEWTGTRMVFRLAPLDGGRTRLDFEHPGLTPALVCFDLCNEGWDWYLASLAAYAQSGQGTPFAAPAKEAAAP